MGAWWSPRSSKPLSTLPVQGEVGSIPTLSAYPMAQEVIELDSRGDLPTHGVVLLRRVSVQAQPAGTGAGPGPASGVRSSQRHREFRGRRRCRRLPAGRRPRPGADRGLLHADSRRRLYLWPHRRGQCPLRRVRHGGPSVDCPQHPRLPAAEGAGGGGGGDPARRRRGGACGRRGHHRRAHGAQPRTGVRLGRHRVGESGAPADQGGGAGGRLPRAHQAAGYRDRHYGPEAGPRRRGGGGTGGPFHGSSQ